MPGNYLLSRDNPSIPFGRVEISFPRVPKYPEAFLIGRDAEIRIDGKPLDVSLLTGAHLHIDGPSDPVRFEFEYIAQSKREDADRASP